MFKEYSICLNVELETKLVKYFNNEQLRAYWGFPGGSEVKASASNEGDLGSIPGLG